MHHNGSCAGFHRAGDAAAAWTGENRPPSRSHHNLVPAMSD